MLCAAHSYGCPGPYYSGVCAVYLNYQLQLILSCCHVNCPGVLGKPPSCHHGAMANHLFLFQAIFELVQGERELIDDLTMVNKLYHNSMRKLQLLTDEELDSIFGIVERLVPFHESKSTNGFQSRGDFSDHASVYSAFTDLCSFVKVQNISSSR